MVRFLHFGEEDLESNRGFEWEMLLCVYSTRGCNNLSPLCLIVLGKRCYVRELHTTTTNDRRQTTRCEELGATSFSLLFTNWRDRRRGHGHATRDHPGFVGAVPPSLGHFGQRISEILQADHSNQNIPQLSTPATTVIAKRSISWGT